jgi:hypothetical protein
LARSRAASLAWLDRAWSRPFQLAIAISTGASARAVVIEAAMMTP